MHLKTFLYVEGRKIEGVFCIKASWPEGDITVAWSNNAIKMFTTFLSGHTYPMPHCMLEWGTGQ